MKLNNEELEYLQKINPSIVEDVMDIREYVRTRNNDYQRIYSKTPEGKAHIKATNAKYYKLNKTRLNAASREYHKVNREKCNSTHHKYYYDHQDACKLRAKNYYQAHKEERKEYSRNHYKRVEK